MDQIIAFANLVWGNTFVRAALGLLFGNVAVGVATSLYTREFRLAVIADWLATRAIPYLLGAGTVQLVLLTIPPEWSGVSAALGTTTWLFVCGALIGHILDSLRAIGLPIPATLGDLSGVVVATRTLPTSVATIPVTAVPAVPGPAPVVVVAPQPPPPVVVAAAVPLPAQLRQLADQLEHPPVSAVQ